MSTTKLTPITLDILKEIVKDGPILVPSLAEQMSIDRGRLEGGLAVLEDKSLIGKTLETIKSYKLTKRGAQANKALIERVLLDKLAEKPMHMKDLQNLEGLDRGDVSAGIGILKRAKLISIDKGTVSIADEQKASDFSQDIVQGLEQISKGNFAISNELEKTLKERGFVEIIEKTQATVEAKINKAELKKIKAVEEVTRLTPEMLSSGSWRDVSFKPYSMDVKPRKIYAGRYHPYRQFLDHLKSKLAGLGFAEMKGPMVEQEFWNFDALYAAQDHPAREDSDILLIKNPAHGKLLKEKYVKNVAKTHEDGWKTGSKAYGYKWDPKKAARLLMRPQGTSISARTLSKVDKPPAKYFSVARCFRPDQIDATHAVEFDQTEGIILDPDITFRDLLGMLRTFAVEVAGASEVRFRPDFYPFTSPSVELSAKHPTLGYIEFGGAGIFRPEVTQPFGIDYPVLAWGLGVGRLFMTKYEISDIRELFSQNIDWLRNARVASGIRKE